MVCAADGGSNTGGAVLQQFFNNEQLSHLSEKIDPQTSPGACHLLHWCMQIANKAELLYNLCSFGMLLRLWHFWFYQ